MKKDKLLFPVFMFIVSILSSLFAQADTLLDIDSLVEPMSEVILISDVSSPQGIGSGILFTAEGFGGTGAYEYEFRRKFGDTWSVVQDYSTVPTWQWDTAEAEAGTYYIGVYARDSGSTTRYEAVGNMKFNLFEPMSEVNLISDVSSPQGVGAKVLFMAAGIGGSGTYEYEFRRKFGDTWSVVQAYSTVSAWQWDTADAETGTYYIGVYARNAGSTERYETVGNMRFILIEPMSEVELISDVSSPQGVGAKVLFTAAGIGGSGTYEYEFRRKFGDTWSVVQAYSTVSAWQWDTADAETGTYYIGVYARNAGSTARYETVGNMRFVIKSLKSVCYVDSDIEEDCLNYDSDLRDCKDGDHRAFITIENAFDYMNSVKEIVIMPGYYELSEPLELSQAEKTISGDTDISGDVFIDCSLSGNCINVSGEKNIIKNITFANSASQKFAVEFGEGGNYNTIYNCNFCENSRHLRGYHIEGLNIINSNFLGVTENSRNAIRFENCGSETPIKISYSTFKPSGMNFSDSLYLKSTEIDFYNNFLTGSMNEGIYVYDDETKLHVANSVIFANGITSYYGGYNINGACSQTTTENSLTMAFVRDDFNLSTRVENINPITGTLGIKAYSKYGLLGLSVDDNINYDYALIMAEEAEKYNLHITWYITPAYGLNSSVKSTIKALLANGHEVGAHGWSHSNLTATNAFTLFHLTATITILIDNSSENSDQWAGSLTLSTGENINLTDPQFDTIGEIVTYLDSLPGYTCTREKEISGNAKSVCLSSVYEANLAEGHAVQFNRDNYFVVEVIEPKEWLETNIRNFQDCPACTTYKCKTYASPFVDTDELVMDMAKLAGYKLLRGTNASLQNNAYSLSSLSLYSVRNLTKNDLQENDIYSTERVVGVLSFLAETGSVSGLFLHKEASFSRQNLSDLFDEIKKFGSDNLFAGSMKEIANIIRNKGFLLEAGLGRDERWKLFIPDRFDATLLFDSSCIDAGVDLGLNRDSYGNYVPYNFVPDVGIFEWSEQ